MISRRRLRLRQTLTLETRQVHNMTLRTDDDWYSIEEGAEDLYDVPKVTASTIYDYEPEERDWPPDLWMVKSDSSWAPSDAPRDSFGVVKRIGDDINLIGSVMNEALIVPTSKPITRRTRKSTYSGQEREVTTFPMYVVVLTPLVEPSVARLTINENGETSFVIESFVKACPQDKQGKVAVAVKRRVGRGFNGRAIDVWHFGTPDRLQFLDHWDESANHDAIGRAHQYLAGAGYERQLVGGVSL